MELNYLKIQAGSFKTLSLDKRTTLIGLGNALNEINFLHKVILVTPHEGQECKNLETTGKIFVLKFSIWGILQRVKELWEFMKKHIHSNPEWANVITTIDDEGARCHEELKQYFGKKNKIDKLRNDFISHYNYNQVKNVLEQMDDEIGFDLIFGNDCANDYFKCADEVYHLASLRARSQDEMKEALDDLLNDSRKLAFNMLGYGRSLIITLVNKLEIEHEVINLEKAPHIKNLRMEYFFEVPAMNDAQQVAGGDAAR